MNSEKVQLEEIEEQINVEQKEDDHEGRSTTNLDYIYEDNDSFSYLPEESKRVEVDLASCDKTEADLVKEIEEEAILEVKK